MQKITFLLLLFISINTVSAQNIVSITPNPAQDIVKIHIKNTEIINVDLYDVLGKKITNTITTQERTSSLWILDVSEISSGVYILSIAIRNEDSYTAKLIKK